MTDEVKISIDLNALRMDIERAFEGVERTKLLKQQKKMFEEIGKNFADAGNIPVASTYWNIAKIFQTKPRASAETTAD